MQQYLYAPTTVGAEGRIQGQDGVLVQDVAVQKGDTLYGISRKFSGHGSYYPQILLFNNIKDPNLIYPGNIFKVPVSHQAERTSESGGITGAPRGVEAPAVKLVVAAPPAATVTDIPVQDLKKVDAGRDKKRGAKAKVAVPAKKQATAETQHAVPAASGAAASGQNLFERAVKAYRQDDCRSALELFDRFLAENQASPLAADASLYKAECYLKLSTQK